MHEIKIGDRVTLMAEAPEGNRLLHYGSTGVVCHIIRPRRIGVRWDTGGDEEFHSCNGHCEKDRGWYVFASEIELAVEGEWTKSLPDEQSFDTLLFHHT